MKTTVTTNHKTKAEHFICPMFFLCVFFCAASIHAKEFVYQTTSGKARYNDTVYLSESNEATVTDSTTGDTHTILLDTDNSSLKWTFAKKNGDKMTFSRKGNTITEEGIHKGKTISQSKAIDANPFFASFNFGVTGFYLSGKEKSDFWTVNPDDLKTYKMTLTRMAIESVTYGGVQGEAVKIRVSVSGLPASFFSMYYWVRPSDGICVRTEGFKGGPGSAKVVSELVSEK